MLISCSLFALINKIGNIKSEAQILEKLGIDSLNEMQLAAENAISSSNEVILLSPTGTGKTLAFLLPLIKLLDAELDEVQLLILAPSRELAIQIEQVAREMGTGYKVYAVYGGQHFSKDKINLKSRPSILVGTPGRVADHLRRETFSHEYIQTIVLDEFDKSLEIGFEKEMKEIMLTLRSCRKKVLTSATQGLAIPDFVKMKNAVTIDHLASGLPLLTVKTLLSPTKDKLDTLVAALCHLGEKLGIIFCNYKDSIERVSEALKEKGIPHGKFYGGMEQNDRERSLIKFRNGTHRIILATDLAARGLDIPALDYILHYHLPLREEEWTHRNGRTARMHAEGTAYLLKWAEDALPEFIDEAEVEEIKEADVPKNTEWSTLFISGGRKDKISKGDVAGLFMKAGSLSTTDIGLIELKQDCAFVAVKRKLAVAVADKLNNSRIKKRKVRIYVI